MAVTTHAGFYKSSNKINPLCQRVQVGDYYEYVERAQVGIGLPATVNCPYCLEVNQKVSRGIELAAAMLATSARA